MGRVCPENVRGWVTWSRVAVLCCLEASLSSCGAATKSRTLGLRLTPYPLGQYRARAPAIS
jgi:hypothetical protein